MIFVTRRLIFATFLASIFFGNNAYSQDFKFQRIQLLYDISIEVPSHWVVLSQATRKNIEMAGAAMANSAGVEAPSGKKHNLLAVNATPDPTGAMIRVSVTSPAGFSQAQLKAMTAEDLKYIEGEMLKGAAQFEKAGGPKMLEMQPVRTESIDRQLALVIPYVRAGASGAPPWQVTQYKIPIADRLIEITLSHRQVDAVLWQPILNHVKYSVRFN